MRFFVPLSMTYSFRRMNVSQFGTGTFEIWIWSALSYPVFEVMILLMQVFRVENHTQPILSNL